MPFMTKSDTSKALALDNRQQFPRSKGRVTDRSVTCFLKAWNRSALSAVRRAAPRRTSDTRK